MSSIDGGKTNGYYDPKTDTIVLALDAKKGAYIAFAGHEIVHRIKVQDSKAYEELRNAVIKYLEEDGGFDLEERIREIQKVYETEKKQKLTRAQAVEEIVANSVIPAFSDEKFSSNVAENNKTLAGKIREWIDEFINELKELVSKLSKTKPEVKAVSKDIALLENIRNIIDESLSRTGGIRKAQGEVKTSANAEEKYDFTKSFAEQIEDYKKGKFPKRDTLIIGGTPKVFLDIGLNPLPMTYAQGHLKEVLYGNKDGHDFGETLLKQVPIALETPIAIITSATHPDTSIVALIDILYKNKNFVVPIEIDGYGRINGISINSNALKTVFAKNNALSKLLNDAINDEKNNKIGVFYINKNKAQKAFKQAGLQLPVYINQLLEGFNHSIREENSPVKLRIKNIFESQQFKRWFGKSVAVNEDGTPKILYHQTENDFTVFDLNRKGAGASDNETPIGIFLKETDRDIGLKGKKQMPLFVRLEKPLVVNDRQALVSKAMEMSEEYAELYNKAKEIDKEYSQKHKDAIKAFNDYIIENSKSKNRKTREELYADPKFNELYDAEDVIVEEWQRINRENDKKAKEVLTKVLKAKGYDGVIFRKDVGSFGRTTEAYIVFDNTQVKSATENIGTFDRTNPDIKYSVNEEELLTETDEERAERIKAADLVVYEADEIVAKQFDYEKVKTLTFKNAKQYLQPILENMGIFDTTYTNDELQVSFSFSKTSLSKSINHQSRDTTAGYEEFTYIVSNLENVCKSAYPLEAHLDEKANKNNTGLKMIATLVSSIKKGEYLIPAKLTIKFYNNQSPNLYISIAEKMKKDIPIRAEAPYEKTAAAGNIFKIRLADLLDSVKNVSSFTKRIPIDSILDEKTKSSINEPDMEAVAKETETKKEEMKEIRGVSESSFEKLLTREDLKPTVYQKNALDLFLEADRKLSEINKNIEKLTGLRDKAETGKKAAEFEKDIAYWRREYAKWNSIYNERIAHSDVQALISKAVKLELADLINKYGSIKPGFNPKREISVPKKTSPNKKVRQTARTILESGAITDEMIPEIEKDIIDEKFSYVPLSDDSAKKYAEDYLEKWGYEGGMQAWESTLRQNKRIGKNDIALCEYLLQQAAKNGNIKDVLKLSAELSAEGTRAGQTSQAISLL